MGQSKVRKLTLVAQPPGEPIEIALGEATNRRLFAMALAAQVAARVANAAIAAANAVDAEHKGVVAGVLEVHGVATGPDIQFRHDADRAVLIVPPVQAEMP